MAPKASKLKKVTAVAEKISKKGRKAVFKKLDDIENDEPISDNDVELMNNDDIKTNIIDERATKGKLVKRRKVNEPTEDKVEDLKNNAKGDDVEPITNKKEKAKRGNKKAVKEESSQENGGDEHPDEEEDIDVKAVNVKKGKPKSKGKMTKQKKESRGDIDENEDKQSIEEVDSHEEIIPTKEKGGKAKKDKIVVTKKDKSSKEKAKKHKDVEIDGISSKNDEPMEVDEVKQSKPKGKAKNNKDKTNEKEVKTSKTKGKNVIKEDMEVKEIEKNDSSKENVDENMEVDEVEALKPTKKEKGQKGKQPQKPEMNERPNSKSKSGKNANEVKKIESPLAVEEETVQDGEDVKIEADEGKSEPIEKAPKVKAKRGKILKKESPVNDILKIEEETTLLEGLDDKINKAHDAAAIEKTSTVKVKKGKHLKSKKEESPVDINTGDNLNIEEETTQFEGKEGGKNKGDVAATVEKPSKVKKGKKVKVKSGQSPPDIDKDNLNLEEETMQFEGKDNIVEPEAADKPSKVKGKKGKNSKVKKEESVDNHEKEILPEEDEKHVVSEDAEESGHSEQEQPKDKRAKRATQKKVKNYEEMEEERDKIEKNKNIKRKPKDKPTMDEEEPMPKKLKTEDDESAPKDSKKKAPLKNKATTNYDEIDFSNSSKNGKDQEWNFKIANWNVDGIRAWLTKGGLEYIEYEKPDILCLQEIKCSQEKLPEEVLNIPGYHTYYLCSKTDGYAGVAICTSNLAMHVDYGLQNEELDSEGRIITAEYEQFFLVCTYVPNAGRKLVTMPKRLKWNEEFRKHVKELDKQKPVIICGDMNVAHDEIDLSNPKTNRKNAGFTDEERAGMTELLGDGFIDTFRHLYPDKKDAYTFWTYMMNSRAKNVGWRLDYFIISERLLPALCDNVIRSQVYGSDHCPISLFLHLTKAVKPKLSD